MKNLILPAFILLAVPAAAHAQAVTATAGTLSAETHRVVRATTPANTGTKTCETATWPYIPADCLSQETAEKAAIISQK